MLPETLCDDAAIAAICARHGLGPLPWQPLPALGKINQIYALGPKLVLRVARPTPKAAREAFAEALVAPLAYAAGVATPPLIAFDASCQLVATPYTIYARVAGTPLGAHPDPAAQDAVWRAVGANLALLHTQAPRLVDILGLVETVSPEQPQAHWPALDALGGLSAPQKRLLADCMAALDDAQPCLDAPAILHGDAHPFNVLIDADGAFAALIDWGDGCWGDPAHEFVWMPLAAVPHALAGYRSIAPLPADAAAERRILREHLGAWLRHALLRSPDPLPAITALLERLQTTWARAWL